MKKSIAIILATGLAACSFTACSEDGDSANGERTLTAEEAIYKTYCETQKKTSFDSCIDQLTEAGREETAKVPKCKDEYLTYFECCYSYAEPNGEEAKKNCDTMPAASCLLENYMSDGSENKADTSPMTAKECYDEYCNSKEDYAACEKAVLEALTPKVEQYPKCENEIYHMMKCMWPLSKEEAEVKCEDVTRKAAGCAGRNGYTWE